MTPHFGIIVIEDDTALLNQTVQALRKAGHHACGITSTEAFDEKSTAPVDMLIMDINVPGKDDLQFIRRLRAAQPRIGIIMVTAPDIPVQLIAGYMTGADIYLTRPITMGELLAAVQALGLRIAASQMAPDLPRLSERKLQLEFDNKSATLTDPETRILAALARAAGQRLEKWQLLEIAGSDDFSKGALEVRMARLRKKLSHIGLPAHSIRAIRNFGYQLCISLHLV